MRSTILRTNRYRLIWNDERGTVFQDNGGLDTLLGRLEIPFEKCKLRAEIIADMRAKGATKEACWKVTDQWREQDRLAGV